MTQTISSLNWQPTAPSSNERVAIVKCDSAIDLNWQINILGNVSDNPFNVDPKYLTVDNLANGSIVNVGFGPYLFTTPAFQRETYEIPNGTRLASILLSKGTVNVYLGSSKPANDISNNLLVQQTSVKTLIYGFNVYGADQPMQIADQNSNVLFNPSVADMTYSLANIPNLPVGNGWFQFIRNLGTKKVTILPFGGQFINGVFTNAAPLVLRPGDSGNLSSDGSNWFFQGEYSFESAEQALANNVVLNIPHGMGQIPASYRVLFRNKVAEQGYTVGDEVEFTTNVFYNGASAGALDIIAVSVSSSAFFVMLTDLLNNVPRTKNKSTASRFTITPSSWRIVVKATATW